MPLPHQSVGLPTAQPIPDKWSEAPRLVMASTWTAVVSIRHPGGTKGTFDPTTGTYPVVPHPPHYSDAARIQVLSTQERSQLVAEDDVTTAAYRAVVDLACDAVAPDDIVEVTTLDTTIGDALTVGTELTVRSFGTGSLAWERDLICIHNLS